MLIYRVLQVFLFYCTGFVNSMTGVKSDRKAHTMGTGRAEKTVSMHLYDIHWEAVFSKYLLIVCTLIIPIKSNYLWWTFVIQFPY